MLQPGYTLTAFCLLHKWDAKVRTLYGSILCETCSVGRSIEIGPELRWKGWRRQEWLILHDDENVLELGVLVAKPQDKKPPSSLVLKSVNLWNVNYISIKKLQFNNFIYCLPTWYMSKIQPLFLINFTMKFPQWLQWSGLFEAVSETQPFGTKCSLGLLNASIYSSYPVYLFSPCMYPCFESTVFVSSFSWNMVLGNSFTIARDVDIFLAKALFPGHTLELITNCPREPSESVGLTKMDLLF